MGAFAWVTLATNDSYSLGALVLAHSLKQAGTAHQLAVLVTPGVTSAMREKLAAVFNVVQEVNILDSRDEANLRLLKRPELGITFTKLHCWRLTQFEKCVFLDADTLVLQNSDELFEREELSAAPDVGWPDCFNSGVFVYRPSLDTYEKLIQFALEKGSFDGGDQGLLNLYFSDWAHKDISKHLPFIYNMCSTACYSYLPAFKQFGANAKIIHFIGPQKPWLQYFNTETKKVQPSGDSSHLQEVLQRWWDIFCSLIHPHLSPAMQGQSQHGISPSYVPPQYHPPTNPTASADDYENTWDPWDEYDQKVAQNAHHTLISTHYNQNQSIESLNTNASRVANQPSIHSQPQPHNYNTNSVQNNSYYQPSPPQVVYHNIPRVPTPPATPRPQYYHQPPEFHHHQPPETRHFHSESHQQHSEPQYYHEQQSSQEHNNEHQYDQNRHSDPQVYHNESQSHQEYNREQRHDQYHHSEPQFYHNEPHSYQEHQHSEQYHFDAQTESHEQIDYSSEESHKKDGHVQTYPSFSHTPERPGSPNRPDQIPVLPKECEATTTVSNDMSLSSTIEDSSKHEDAGLAGAFSQLTLGVARTPEQDALENILRKQAWEVGNIDYLGRDSFENIWSKITETLSFGAPQPEASAPAPEQEVPSAPAESQSQTAPQEEAIPVQTPVLPLDTSTPKIDSIESSPSVEVQKDDEPKLEVSVDTSTKEGTTEETKPVSSSEVAPADVIKEVVTSPEPKSEVSQGLIEKEPPTESAATPVTEPATAPVEPAATPVPEPAVAPSTEPAAEPLPTPTAAPVTQSVSAAVTESTALPLTEPVAKPVTEPAAAPVTGIVAAPVAEPPAALVVETAQPVAEPVAAKAVTEPVAEPLSCPIPPKKDAQEKPSSEPQPIPAQAVAPESVVSQSTATQESPQVSPQSVQTKPAPVDPSVGSTEPAVAPTPSSPSAAEPSAADLELSAEPAVTTPAADISKPTESSVPTKSSPKTKVTEATPPATPATPPVEKTKSALTAEATVPDTPPPSEGGSTPTPPPRKTDKPKKAAAKQKK